MKPPEVDRIAGSRAAVAARRARAEVKRAVASGQRLASEVLDSAIANKPAESSLRVSELISSIQWIGPTRTARIMQELGISPSKRLGGLGIHQRSRLRAFLLHRQSSVAPGSLVVLAGPTAVGKGTVSAYIRDHHPEVMLSVSATTRAPRPGEIDGVTYYFVDDLEFDRMIGAGEFLEWATVHNAFRYGTPRAPIDQAIAEGKSVLLEIDIQGARQVRKQFPTARLVFLLPPSWDELVHRLIGRGTEDEGERDRRLATARLELEAQNEFDFRVVNAEVPQAAQQVVQLMAP